jgi:nitroreductase
VSDFPGNGTLPLADIIARRFSSRRFAPDPVAPELVTAVLEAARWAPSYGNRQSWRFVVVRDPAALERVHAALTRGNAYAKVAPVMIALCADPEDGQIVDGKQYYLMDGGLALENLLLQAVALDLHAHPMGGFDETMVRFALSIPEHVRVLCLTALGHPGRLEDLDERSMERELRPRTRKTLDEIVMEDEWTAS